MDSLQEQVTALTIKMDALHHMLEQLGQQATDILLQLQGSAGDRPSPLAGSSVGRHPYHSYASRSAFESEMDHKDILSDVSYPDPETQGGDRNLSPEIQIQRLTAQLTAAYNRIAALEEQLLAKRIP